jgi:hypothetical protein
VTRFAQQKVEVSSNYGIVSTSVSGNFGDHNPVRIAITSGLGNTETDYLNYAAARILGEALIAIADEGQREPTTEEVFAQLELGDEFDVLEFDGYKRSGQRVKITQTRYIILGGITVFHVEDLRSDTIRKVEK